MLTDQYSYDKSGIFILSCTIYTISGVSSLLNKELRCNNLNQSEKMGGLCYLINRFLKMMLYNEEIRDACSFLKKNTVAYRNLDLD
jgi:hypothetical protein